MIECPVRSAECGVRSERSVVETASRALTVRGVSLFLGAVFLLTAAASIAGEAAIPGSMKADTAPAEKAAGLIEAHYRDLADLTAAVVQKNHLRMIDKTQTFEGTLFIKRPGKLRLEYTNGQVIVIAGSEAWFYSRKSEQAIRRSFRDFEQANIPVAFLLGAAEIGREFDVSNPDPERPLMIDLVPKRKAGAAMQKLRLQVDERGAVTHMTVYDRSGNTSDVSFSNIREGVGLDDDLFRFKVPKGTEIIEQ